MRLILHFAPLLLLCTILPQAHAAAEPQTFPTSAGPVKITPLYHASTLIEAGGKTIYVDPAKPAKLTGLPKADLILISHIHGDHMDPASIQEVSKADTEILAPAAVAQTVTSARSRTGKRRLGRVGALRRSRPTT
jgi:glyoxylase-like metal-dependent hydrolase (beta-lactamase superfamily II)